MGVITEAAEDAQDNGPAAERQIDPAPSDPFLMGFDLSEFNVDSDSLENGLGILASLSRLLT